MQPSTRKLRTIMATVAIAVLSAVALIHPIRIAFPGSDR
jgi:hypothetical protein